MADRPDAAPPRRSIWKPAFLVIFFALVGVFAVRDGPAAFDKWRFRSLARELDKPISHRGNPNPIDALLLTGHHDGRNAFFDVGPHRWVVLDHQEIQFYMVLEPWFSVQFASRKFTCDVENGTGTLQLGELKIDVVGRVFTHGNESFALDSEPRIVLADSSGKVVYIGRRAER